MTLQCTTLLHAGINQRTIRKEILCGLFVTILATALGIILSHVIATELDWSGKSMSWYQHTFFAVLLYCCPALAIHTIFYSRLTRNRESALSLGLKVQARINGVNLLWALITIGITLAGYRTAYVFLIPVLVHLVSTGIIVLLKAQNTSRISVVALAYKTRTRLLSSLFIRISVKKWMYVHLAGQVITILWTTAFYHSVVGMFIPIAGRSGAANNPDVTIGILCCVFTLFITSYIVSGGPSLLRSIDGDLFMPISILIFNRFRSLAFCIVRKSSSPV